MNQEICYDLADRVTKILEAWVNSSQYARTRLLEMLSVPIMVSNLKGDLLDINSQGCYLLAYNREEILRKNIADLSDYKIRDEQSGGGITRFFNGQGGVLECFVNTYAYQEHIIYFLVDATGYQKPEEALLVCEQRYTTLAEQATDGISIVGRDRFIYANQSFCKLFGYELEEIIEINPFDLIDTRDRDFIKKNAAQVFAQQQVLKDIEIYRGVSKNGKVIICELDYCSVIHRGEYAIQVRVRDITEKQQLEERLHEAEQEYRVVVENTYDEICIFDGERLVYANQRLCTSSGYSREELFNLNNWEWIAPEYRKTFARVVRKNLTGISTPIHHHAQLLTKSGQRKTYEFALSSILFNKRVSVIIIARDVTEQRQREKEKRFQRRKMSLVNRMLRIIAENQRVDQACYKMLSLFRDEFSMYGFEMFLRQDNDTIKAFCSSSRYEPFSYIISRRDSQELLLAMEHRQDVYRNFSPEHIRLEDRFFYSSGYNYLIQIPILGVSGVRGLFRWAGPASHTQEVDQNIATIIAELFLAIESLMFREKITQVVHEAAEKEKEELLGKFSLIGDMSTTIAHEVRNPMTTVRGMAQMLAVEHPEKASYYKLMIEEIDRANHIISEFVRLSRHTMSCKEELDMVELVNRILDSMKHEVLPKGITITSEIDSGPILVLADENQIYQVIVHIFKNAMEASAPGGIITIGLSAEDNTMVLYIRDNGLGINPDEVKHIMEPFFTTKDENTGLGLPVSYKTIKEHGGDLEIESLFNQGTTAKITLPTIYPLCSRLSS